MKFMRMAGAAVLVMMWATVTFADPLPIGQISNSPVLSGTFSISSSVLTRATTMVVDPNTGVVSNRGTAGTIQDAALGSRALTYVALGSATGVNVLAYSNTSTLMNAATILAGQGQSLSTVSMGRVSYHELLIVAAPGGATVITGDVPEPATLMLIGGGLILLALSLRKRGKINEL